MPSDNADFVSKEPVSLRVDVDDVSMIRVLGVHDRVLKQVEREFPDVSVYARGNQITIEGESHKAHQAMELIRQLVDLAKTGVEVDQEQVTHSARIARETNDAPTDILAAPILARGGRSIRPKTLGQKRYVDSIDSHTIVFGIGPAGTGKTYLAMAKAVAALESKAVDRIILTRPAVEAGERLGFLPGTLSEKIDPYLRPLFDALQEMMNPELVPKLLASGTLEVAPLAYMRGRTLNKSFIILDEAQNTTAEQMKMFLTRLGFDSRMVITGDITQVDVPGGHSGLRAVVDILKDVDGVHFHHLGASDIVRHQLVSDIVDAYARYDAAKEQR